MSLNTVSIPTTLSEALSCEKCKNATNVKFQALEKNKVWEVVGLPKRKRLVGCKWVFIVKYKAMEQGVSELL